MAYLYPSPNHNGIFICASPSGDKADLQCQIKKQGRTPCLIPLSRGRESEYSGRTSRIRVGARKQARCRRAREFLRAPRRWVQRARLRLRQGSVEPSVRALLSVLHVSPSRRRSSAPPRVRRNWRNSVYIPRARYIRDVTTLFTSTVQRKDSLLFV